ncbi:DUF1713 domain-containing protein [Trichonephila clavata]|uniref:DUF1713 domain-containing protein n=1 Tax=Trichonephila clavata TaxID=2740835 RepID=A0A8X6J2N7_TRICU|nr:DUF1713 domain-containing protein [Trichonephila clavata]
MSVSLLFDSHWNSVILKKSLLGEGFIMGYHLLGTIIMALRQFTSKCCKPLWSYMSLVKSNKILPVGKNSPKFPDSFSKCLENTSVRKQSITSTRLSSLVKEQNATPLQSNNYIDFVTNNLHKKFYMPTSIINRVQVYEDVNTKNVSINENFNQIKIIDPPPQERIFKKECVRMIRIRRRKMRKHKLKKLRKRMKFVFAKMKMKKDLRKEQEFRVELLTQVETADKFDAKAYVEEILNTLKNRPIPETPEETRERFRLLKKKNKYNTTFIRPRFDD